MCFPPQSSPLHERHGIYLSVVFFADFYFFLSFQLNANKTVKTPDQVWNQAFDKYFYLCFPWLLPKMEAEISEARRRKRVQCLPQVGGGLADISILNCKALFNLTSQSRSSSVSCRKAFPLAVPAASDVLVLCPFCRARR